MNKIDTEFDIKNLFATLLAFSQTSMILMRDFIQICKWENESSGLKIDWILDISSEASLEYIWHGTPPKLAFQIDQTTKRIGFVVAFFLSRLIFRLNL